MLKISFAGCLGLSPAVSAQFTLKMCVAAQNREKFTKKKYFGGSRSFKVIDVGKSKIFVKRDPFATKFCTHSVTDNVNKCCKFGHCTMLPKKAYVISY